MDKPSHSDKELKNLFKQLHAPYDEQMPPFAKSWTVAKNRRRHKSPLSVLQWAPAMALFLAVIVTVPLLISQHINTPTLWDTASQASFETPLDFLLDVTKPVALDQIPEFHGFLEDGLET